MSDGFVIDKASGVRVMHARVSELEEQNALLITAGNLLYVAARGSYEMTGDEEVADALQRWQALMRVLRD